MTDKQIERVKIKIKRIRATLVAEKKFYGDYDDSRGLRYVPVQLYLKIGDFSGGLVYLRWFQRNFPNDIGYPHFFFEWTVILFKNKKFKEAERKAFQTFCSNTCIFDNFINSLSTRIDKQECLKIDTSELSKLFAYSTEPTELSDFKIWLENIIATNKFQESSSKFLALRKRLRNEKDSETRMYLTLQARQLEENYN